MIALVTIIDEKTGRIYDKDLRVIPDFRSSWLDGSRIEKYHFEFEWVRLITDNAEANFVNPVEEELQWKD